MVKKVKYKNLVFIILSFFFIFFIARGLNPFNKKTFSGHDATQAARVVEFSENLINLQIPPRVSRNMSFGLGYPIFNYYSPTAYWITSSINFLGLNVAKSLELSYLLAICLGFFGMYFLIKDYLKDKLAALVASCFYISSPYIAVDIFVRSNLSEIWFFALLPWSLYMLKKVDRKSFFLTSFIVSLALTSHNIFSLMLLPILIIYAILLKKRTSFFSIFAGFLMASYFLIPAIFELNNVWAREIAKSTNFNDHFVCLRQFWYSPWGFGGSALGCENDGLSFMLGKLHIVFGVLGGGVFALTATDIKNKKVKNIFLAILILTLGSFFMSISQSSFIWNIFEPILAIFQFPWRFLLFVVFGLSVFVAYFIHKLPNLLKFLSTIILIFFLIILSPKFFKGNEISEKEFISNYASKEYIQNKAAYQVAEYLPKSVDYEYWRSLEDRNAYVADDFVGYTIYEESSNEVTFLPIHYAPYWEILIDNKKFLPKNFDKLGRPEINNKNKNAKIEVFYRQTNLEFIVNAVSLIAILATIFYSSTNIWKKNKI